MCSHLLIKSVSRDAACAIVPPDLEVPQETRSVPVITSRQPTALGALCFASWPLSTVTKTPTDNPRSAQKKRAAQGGPAQRYTTRNARSQYNPRASLWWAWRRVCHPTRPEISHDHLEVIPFNFPSSERDLLGKTLRADPRIFLWIFQVHTNEH